MGRPLANSSLSCQLPVVSQCPLGRWDISCSWRATGPHTVGERDAYRVGAWKRRDGQRTGGKGRVLGGPGVAQYWQSQATGRGRGGGVWRTHTGTTGRRGSWEPCPRVRLWLGWEVMTGRSTPRPSSPRKSFQTSLKQSHDFVLDPSRPNITPFSYTLCLPAHIINITHLEHSIPHLPRTTT